MLKESVAIHDVAKFFRDHGVKDIMASWSDGWDFETTVDQIESVIQQSDQCEDADIIGFESMADKDAPAVSTEATHKLIARRVGPDSWSVELENIQPSGDVVFDPIEIDVD